MKIERVDFSKGAGGELFNILRVQWVLVFSTAYVGISNTTRKKVKSRNGSSCTSIDSE